LCIFFLLAVTVLPNTVVAAEQTAPAAVRVVKVGNIMINQFDVDQRAQRLMPMQVSFHGGISAEKIAEVKALALDELIDRAYKVQYAIDNEIVIDAVAFEKEWQERLAKNPEAVSKASAAQLSKVRADLYLDKLAARAEEVAVEEKIKVSDQVVADYYEVNKEKYFRPEQYTASHVFVKVDPSDNAEEKAEKLARAEALYERALTGEDFYNLAYYESDDRSKYVGGSLGTFHAGQTVPEFDSAIQKMKAGEIVGPIRTMYGFHIIKLDSLDDARQLRFDEVSAKIRATMEETERKQYYEAWMSELTKSFPVERFDQ
jgi:parvulin-like peptidyl-prolyl isomerase